MLISHVSCTLKTTLYDRDETRTRNLLIRSQTPYPLGHAAGHKSGLMDKAAWNPAVQQHPMPDLASIGPVQDLADLQKCIKSLLPQSGS